MPITTTPSGGPQGEFSTYTPIYSQTLSATASSITFSNIPTTFTDLVLVANAKQAAGLDSMGLQFNGDTGSNYSNTTLSGNGTAASSFRQTSQTQMNIGLIDSNDGNSILHIMNYANPTTFKTVLGRGNVPATFVRAAVGLWRSTAVITSVTVWQSNPMSIGSQFTLYGIKAAATQFIPTKAAGGDIVVSDGTYAYHVFRSSGIFAAAQSLTCDVLVVAGGGAAGANQGGGGGAGGLRALSSQSLGAGINYSCTIGAGGASTNYGGGGNAAASGSNSSFIGSSLSISATGGGGGGNQGNAASGGSGGGGTGNNGSNASGNAGSYSPVEGFAGAPGRTSGGQWGGGGGGAGGVPENPNTTGSATGGIGATSSLINSMGAATTTGQLSGGNYYYAGGGGGCKYQSDGYSGGLGGGGAGGQATGSNAVVNTGGGGGGQSAGGGGFAGAGGSGIVIVRYPV